VSSVELSPTAEGMHGHSVTKKCRLANL